jgi:Sperm tail C-terminal domain
MGVQTKKKTNFESEEQKAERDKKQQKIFWEKLTTVLSPQKLSIWKALDSTLSNYYKILSDRQNLIEKTGLLN